MSLILVYIELTDDNKHLKVMLLILQKDIYLRLDHSFYEARILKVLSCGSRKYLEIQFDGNISKVKRLNKNFLRLSFGIMIDIVMGNVCCQYSHD